MTILLVALGGALGAILRFALDGEIKGRSPLAWPVATLFINIAGSFALGALDASHLSASTLAFAGTGICGGFTTFSTASVESVSLLRARHGAVAVGYALGTFLACWAACAFGAQL